MLISQRAEFSHLLSVDEEARWGGACGGNKMSKVFDRK